MGVKLTKDLFKRLNDEKKKADAHAFNVDVAIQSLQNICNHEWEEQFLVDQYEPPSCKICGASKEEIQGKPL